MKKIIVSLVLVLAMTMTMATSIFAFNPNKTDWKTKPVITSAYELDKDNIYLEWNGEADLYQINVDGKNKDTVNIESASIKLKDGAHQIIIIPLNYASRDVDTKFALDIAIFSGSIDLGILGIDPKDLVQGNPSDALKLNYSTHPIVNAEPEITNAFIDPDGRVILEFTDNFDAEIYRITIKSGKDINYVEYHMDSEEDAKYVEKEYSTVKLTLDPEYLRAHECLIPELNHEYSFSVKLQKRPENFVTGNKEDSSLLESKDGNFFEYTPHASWMDAPEITYASQTADGQVTLQWEHDDNGIGCEYKIIQIDKVLVVKSGENEIGRTSDKEYVIEDLKNGKYTFAVIPVLQQEKGAVSEEGKVSEEGEASEEGKVFEESAASEEGKVSEGAEAEEGAVAEEGKVSEGVEAEEGAVSEKGKVSEEGEASEEGKVSEGAEAEEGAVAEKGKAFEEGEASEEGAASEEGKVFEEGEASEEVKVEVKNEWVAAPSLICKPGEDGQVVLKWKAPESIESYHVKVYAEGDSILKYISLDYDLIDEFDITAQPGDMEYIYTFDQGIEPVQGVEPDQGDGSGGSEQSNQDKSGQDKGVKLKFEIYGTRHAANGEEQKSAASSQTVVVK